MPPTFVTKAEVIGWMKLTPDVDLKMSEVNTRNVVLDVVIGAASEAVHSDCRRAFEQTTEDRTFYPDYRRQGRLRIGDHQTISEVTDDGETLTVDSDYMSVPNTVPGRPAIYLERLPRPTVDMYGRREEWWRGPVVVSATWGWASIPNAVKQATLLLTAREYQRSKIPLGAIDTDSGPIPLRMFDPDYVRLVESFDLVAVA